MSFDSDTSVQYVALLHILLYLKNLRQLAEEANDDDDDGGDDGGVGWWVSR